MRMSLLLTVPIALGLTACGGSSAPSGSGGSDIAISSGESSCDVAATTLDAGKHTFTVTNTGKDVTEVYVYGKGGDGDFNKVVGEVENIAPQTSRDFPVTLSGGEYEVACKPGQKGEGIRTKVTVSGPTAVAGASAYDRNVEVTAKEYALTGLAGYPAKVGERIEFTLENRGTTQHELEVLGPDGKAVGEVGPTDPGKGGEVVLTLATAGTYTYLCGIADHADRGMRGSFTVR